MYSTSSSSRYTFVSSASTDASPQHYHQQQQQQQRQGQPRPSFYSRDQLGDDTHRHNKARSDRCDVHHSIAQLYLRTLSSFDALHTTSATTRRGSSDTSEKKLGSRSKSRSEPKSKSEPSDSSVKMEAQFDGSATPTDTPIPTPSITTNTAAATVTAARGAVAIDGDGSGIRDGTLAKSAAAAATTHAHAGAKVMNLSASFLQSQQEAFPALHLTDESDASSSVSTSSSCLSDDDEGRSTRRRAQRHVSSIQLRSMLASSMSNMYRSEVPLYGDLLSIIGDVNSAVIRRQALGGASLEGGMTMMSDEEISRLNVERHGAIRVGTVEELAVLARIFRVFGMVPVGYYDLDRDAGLPIHATAFRPVGKHNLVRNPFRIFCSLLRMDRIRCPLTRKLAQELLGRRKIVSQRCLELLHKAEAAMATSIRDGGKEDWVQEDEDVVIEGLTRAEAVEFVERVVDIFAWHADTPVSLAQYKLLAQTHPLVADIVSFRGPHINHLTPRTLDIDQVQRTMILQGIDAKEVVEGPPVRKYPIYLRQTSFHALSEQVMFLGEGGVEQGKHKARFGEIEARGQALTRKGARLYDDLMAQVADAKRRKEQERGGKRMDKDECVEVLQAVFSEGFPDDQDTLLRQALGFFMFSVKDEQLVRQMWTEGGCEVLGDMVKAGALDAEPITYEDFLPASAAGIFQSNLPQSPTVNDPASTSTTPASSADAVQEVDEAEARRTLETAVGGTILDYFTLYSEQQRESLAEVAAIVGVDMHHLAATVESQGL